MPAIPNPYGSAGGTAAWQFKPETYGAAGDLAIASDIAITSGQATITTAGVADPSATTPTVSHANSGGTIAIGTYQVQVTYVTASGGETLPSLAGSTTTTTNVSTITVTTPAVNGVPGGAIGYRVYMTAAGGSTFFLQTAVVTSPQPFPNSVTFTAPPVTNTAQPPAANTTVSSPWSSMKAGQAIRIVGAGAAGADLRTTILSVGAASATLAANAGTSVSRNGAVWGTDDTAAIQSAVNAAAAYGSANNREGQVLFSKLYLSNTAPTVGGTFGGNCVIQLPSVANGAPKARVTMVGLAPDVSTLPVYQQMLPEMSGCGVCYIGPNGTNDATYGPASVFGTPTAPSTFVTESGNIPGTTNIKTGMDSIRVVVPWAGGISGIDLYSAAESANFSCSTQALAIVPSAGSWTRMLANGPLTNQFGWGLREPAAGNNAFSYTDQYACEGMCYGYGPSEHLVSVDVFVAYCITGIESYAGQGISMVHNGHIVSAGVEFCTNAVGALDGAVKMDIDNLRTESVSKIVIDPSNRLQGKFFVRDQGATGHYTSSWVAAGAVATGVVMINGMTPPTPLNAAASGDPGPPATTVAWFNYYYLNAWMTVALSAGGTFTAFTLASANGTQVAEPNAVGAGTYQFMLGPGWSYTPTYGSGTLTHTVKLLST